MTLLWAGLAASAMPLVAKAAARATPRLISTTCLIFLLILIVLSFLGPDGPTSCPRSPGAATLPTARRPGPPALKPSEFNGGQVLVRWKPGGVGMELRLEHDRAKVSSI